MGLPLHQFDREGQAMRYLPPGEHRVAVGGEERAVKLVGVIVPGASGL